MSKGTRLLILGTGSMANTHAEQFAALKGCTLAVAVDVDLARAEAFAEAHSIPRAFGNLAEAIAWGEFDAAANVTPDGVHMATTLDLLAAGKPVFCEKPLAVTYEDAKRMTAAAEGAGLVNMVNFTYRNAAAIHTARAMVEAGEIGDVRHIQASYLQSWLTAAHWGDWHTEDRWLWRLSSAHGSKGVLGDIGVHVLDFTTFGAALDITALSARLKTFDKAEGGKIGAYRLDANDSAAMTVEFSNGALGVVHMSRFATGKANDMDLLIHGERGALKVWTDGTNSRLDACLGADIQTQNWIKIPCKPVPRNEVRFLAALRTGANGDPSFRRGTEMQQLIDLSFVSDAEGRMLRVA